MTPLIYTQDWFSNRNSLGKFNFDKSGSIFNFNSQNVSRTLYGSRINELLEDPRKIERECEAINIIINKNKPVNVVVHKKKDSYTNGKKIVISGKPLIDYYEDGLDVVLGFGVHEMCHIRFTDFSHRPDDLNTNKLLHWIWNVIEDETIEEMLQLEKPGFGNLLGPVKDYMFKQKDEPELENDLDIILYIFFNIIRYPINLKYISENDKIRFEELFNDIYSILKVNNVLNIKIKDNVTSENYKAAKQIYELLKDYLDGMSDGDIQQSLNNINKYKDNILGSTPEMGEQITEQAIEENSKDPIEVEDYDPEYKDNNFDSNRGTSPTSKLRRISKIANGYNTEKYKRYAKELKPYISLIKSININNFQRKHRLEKETQKRNGSLDPRLLASAIQNVKNVYQSYSSKPTKEKNKKFALVLALDESGSMGSAKTRELVTKMAIVFAEAFKNDENVDIYIYGHSDYIVRYVDPSMKFFDVLLDRYQGMGQSEVEAYSTIISDINRNTNSNILFVNITDCQYLSNYSEIANELKSWDKNIFQSLISINNKFTQKDINFNDKVYGTNNWARINNLDDKIETSKELKKIVKYLNNLALKYGK